MIELKKDKVCVNKFLTRKILLLFTYFSYYAIYEFVFTVDRVKWWLFIVLYVLTKLLKFLNSLFALHLHGTLLA